MAATSIPRYGAGKSTQYRRGRKVTIDNIMGVTKPAIRRLARRGGVVRMTEGIYDTVRMVLMDRLKMILKQIVEVVEHCGRTTVLVDDIIFVLKRLGTTIYGFDDVSKKLKHLRSD